MICVPLVDKEEMRKKRENVVKAVQEKSEHEQVERATKKREAEKLAIKQQMQVANHFCASIIFS